MYPVKKMKESSKAKNADNADANSENAIFDKDKKYFGKSSVELKGEPEALIDQNGKIMERSRYLLPSNS